MPVHHAPESLEFLAIKAMGSMVSEKFSRLLESPDQCKLQKTFVYLKNLIHNNIPHGLINALTLHLLRRLDDNTSFRREYLLQASRKRVLRQFLEAILSPKITILKICWQWRFIGDIVHLEIGHLSNLKELRLCDSEWFDGDRTVIDVPLNLNSIEKLEYLTLQSKCTDEILEILSRKCLKLKELDINGSSSVTDSGVRYILKFESLKSLDVTYTGLTDKGRAHVLSGLSRHKCLESYACNHITNNELNILVTSFPTLVALCVRFINININLDILQKFEVLQVFKTENYLPHFHSNLFQIIGRNLVEMQLAGYTVYLPDVQENCPVLKKLTLKIDAIQTDNHSGANFENLTHLTLLSNDSSSTAFFLTCCPNLTTLELITVPEFYTQYQLESVVLQNPLRYLKRLSVGTLNNDLPPSTLWFIALHWNLISCKVLLNNCTNAGQYKEFPGVQVDCDLWTKITQLVRFSDMRRKPKKTSKGHKKRLYQYAKTIQ